MSGSIKAAPEFEFTPQETVASRMLGTRRDAASRDDFDFFHGALPGWKADTVTANGVMQTGFDKPSTIHRIDRSLIVVASRVCQADRMRIELLSDAVRVNLPGTEVSPKHLARLAMVDFSISPNVPQAEKFERMARIIGTVQSRSKVLGENFQLPEKDEEEEVPVAPSFNFLEQCEIGDDELEKLSLLRPAEVKFLADIHLPTGTLAKKFGVEETTVRSHVQEICKKIGTGNIRDLIILSIGSGMSNITQEEIDGYKLEQKPDLSPRQSFVFDCMVNGVKYEKIASLLGVKRGTVASHMHEIYLAFNISNKKDCILSALFNGINIRPEIPSQSRY